MNKFLFLFLSFYLQEVLLDICTHHKTCHDCIRDTNICVWCASKMYDNEQRCKSKRYTDTNSTWCPDSLQILENNANATEDKPFNSDSENVTQIRPELYKMELRPGQPQNFSFSFKLAQDYPVDLYFLFDMSATMGTLRETTSQQSENIYKTMLNMTNNVVMGMGTFVDKNMLPYANQIASHSAYSFRHRLSLTDDYQIFQKAVKDAPQGENRDNPEGGLDALAQAIVCKEVIGWRAQSRKIVVVLTDNTLHAAGDGRSAGLFKPYNGSCFTENDVYTKELEMDYPSVSMISKLARDNNVIVIFAVAGEEETYRKLIGHITGSKMFTLTKDDKDVDNEMVKKLKEIYEEISTKIKLNVNIQTESTKYARRKNFDIKFEPDCTKDLAACNITTNDIKHIDGHIILKDPENYEKAIIDITVEGTAEKLTLDIDILKNCLCEQEIDIEYKSTYCSNQTLKCGICECNEPWYGVTCQCNRDLIASATSTKTCKMGDTDENCSGRGTCLCGKCSCNAGFVGPYCECFMKNCPLHGGVICGHGDCQCDGKCKCHQGWSGNACECDDTDLCLAPNNKVCNKRGKCNCGECICDSIASWDKRNDFTKYCVIKPCPECHSPQCEALTECAHCLLEEEKEKESGCNECNFITSKIVDKLPEKLNHSDNNVDWHICEKISLGMGCYTNFVYKYQDDPYGIRMMLEKDKNCAESYYIYGGLVLLCVLLVGIFTLLGWKLITYLRDRQEYLQFMENHVPDAAPCDNPLYEPASTTFRNPAFGKRSIH